eukprot:scaffold1868_cov194-Alexandrium_tamarense.AAC.18
MGNASSSHHESSVSDRAGSSAGSAKTPTGGNDTPSGDTSTAGSAAHQTTIHQSASSITDSKYAEGGRISSGIFNPNVSIQTLGSAGGPSSVEDVSGYYYGVGGYYPSSNYEGNSNTVGSAFGAALGGGANQNNLGAGSSDVLISTIARDFNPASIGGQIVGIQRLWPGSGRMMRSYRLRVRVPRMDSPYGIASTSGTIANPQATADDLPVIIELACKSFIVRSEKGENPLRLTLTEGDAELKRLRSLLSDPSTHPHILSYARWIVGPPTTTGQPSPTNTTVSRPIHLLRQHAHASLSDRLVSRPFLTLIEKNWITYQLLNAVQSLHDVGVCHGHLTTENVLLTSWNWVLISDVGCQHYKPVALPDDDPGMWIHWFEGRAGEERKPGVGSAANQHHRSSNGEKKCCLAPERFYTPGKTAVIPTKLDSTMDVFSLGCVLIELFLNGERALELGDLMEYRRQGEKEKMSLPPSLKQKLDKIESSRMRAACRLMLSLDPSMRLTAAEYLDRLSSSRSSSSRRMRSDSVSSEGGDQSKPTSSHAPLPPCFKATLVPFMLRLRTEILSPDGRIALVACHYGSILKATVGLEDIWGEAYFSRALGPTLLRLENSESSIEKVMHTTNDVQAEKAKTDFTTSSISELLLETEGLLRQLDSGLFGSGNENVLVSQASTPQTATPLSLIDHFPQSPFNAIPSQQASPSQASIILLLQVVFSSVRHVQRPSSKFVALMLMQRIALYSSDEMRLQRIVPFVTSLLQDSEPIIRASGITVLASVLSTVTSFPPSDAQIFPRYVFKKVAHLITDATLVVRVAFAQNIALLAETALRFLDVGHSVSLYDAVSGRNSRDGRGEDGMNVALHTPLFSEEMSNLLNDQNSTDAIPSSSPSKSLSDNAASITIRNSYDSDIALLHEVVLRWVVHITTDTSDHSSQSKQALLGDLSRLCNFFGSEYSFQILPQILAFLNDRKDWQLRAALLRHLPSVCVAVGKAATESFVVPCVESALNDDVEQVTAEALCCLATLVNLSLLTRVTLLGTEGGTRQSEFEGSRPHRKKQGVLRKCAPLLLHPSPVVRTKAASLVMISSQVLNATDTEAFVYQILLPFLQYKPTFESIDHLMECLKAPTASSSQVPKDFRTLLTSLEVAIDFSVKLANGLSVPTQQSFELIASGLPKWYESLQRASLDTSTPQPFFPLGFWSLQKG